MYVNLGGVGGGKGQKKKQNKVYKKKADRMK